VKLVLALLGGLGVGDAGAVVSVHALELALEAARLGDPAERIELGGKPTETAGGGLGHWRQRTMLATAWRTAATPV